MHLPRIGVKAKFAVDYQQIVQHTACTNVSFDCKFFVISLEKPHNVWSAML